MHPLVGAAAHPSPTHPLTHPNKTSHSPTHPPTHPNRVIAAAAAEEGGGGGGEGESEQRARLEELLEDCRKVSPPTYPPTHPLLLSPTHPPTHPPTHRATPTNAGLFSSPFSRLTWKQPPIRSPLPPLPAEEKEEEEEEEETHRPWHEQVSQPFLSLTLCLPSLVTPPPTPPPPPNRCCCSRPCVPAGIAAV